MIIRSKENQLYKFILSLGTKKGRDKAAAFIIEGERFVREALEYCQVSHIALSESYAAKNTPPFFMEKQVVFSDGLFNSIAATEHTQGILAVCEKTFSAPDISVEGKHGRLFLLVEDINDPGNLGAIIRAADAAGVDAIWLSPGCADLYNPKVLRGAAGSALHLPVVEGADLRSVISGMKDNGVAVYAAHLAGAAYPYGLDLTDCCAFLIGNEARGLKSETAALADVFIKLPMIGKAESLNAAMAAGILLYEALRQRIMVNKPERCPNKGAGQ